MREETRKSPWFVTFSGIKFFPAEPKAHEILLLDIAHALSQINRFGGHTARPYSVAAHSLLVSSLLPWHLRLQGLMHDAAEAYVGDLVSPVKEQVPEFKVLEKKVWRAVAERFDLPLVLDPLVKEADLFALRLERDTLIRNTFRWPVDDMSFTHYADDKVEGIRIPHYLTAESARDAFSDRYFKLTGLSTVGPFLRQ
jgi:hypothetical protein